MLFSSRFVIAHDHPSGPGHFPGRPIVPGVVLLDCTMAALLRDHPSTRLVGFDEVKFVFPVLPGAQVSVIGDDSTRDRLTFACAVDGRTVLRGRARLGRAG
jgi:3-hydroxymyristoyl/3-hydroxydecanoyl-(acyl carrier protein) dehydratase